MSTTLSGSMTAGFNIKNNSNATGLSQGAQISLNKSPSINFSTGTTTANQANRAYLTLLTLAAGANTALNLQSLTDQLNLSLNMTRVKGILAWLPSVSDDSTNGSNATSVLVGQASANAALAGNASIGGMLDGTSPGVRVFNSGFITLCNPTANGTPIDATHNQLKILNEDGSNQAKLFIGFVCADA